MTSTENELNQQRTKTNEQGVRSETPASSWAVSLIHGALKKHPALMVLSRGRPELVVTDGHLDLIDFENPKEATWTCDLLLMPHGINGQYNLVIEIKTSSSCPSHEPFTVFAHIMGLERNRFQMSKITGLNKPWWYVVVLIDKLTASTDEEYASRMWACPTIWYQGLPGASFPNAALGPKTLSQIVVEMRNSLPLERDEQMLSIKMPSTEQLAFPIDDVPAVTMNTPLKISVEKPAKASITTATTAPISSHAAPSVSGAQQQVAHYQVALADDPKAPEGKGADAFDYAFEQIRRVDFSLMMNDMERSICQRLDAASSTLTTLGECIKELMSELEIKIKYDRPAALVTTQALLENASARQCLAMYLDSFRGLDSSVRSAGFVFARKVYVSPKKATGNLISMSFYFYLGSLVR